MFTMCMKYLIEMDPVEKKRKSDILAGLSLSCVGEAIFLNHAFTPSLPVRHLNSHIERS